MSSEAQAGELRSRARRRLIGALALVVAAVIIVPMLFDSSTPPEEVSTPVVVPAITPPTPAQNLASATPPTTSAEQPLADQAANPDGMPTDPAAGAIQQPDAPEVPDAAVSEPAVEKPESAEPPAAAEPKPEPKPKPAEKPEAQSKTPATSTTERTDDGSVAIALLEGRVPAKTPPAPVTKGNFILQIAAYTNDKDAQVRRERLVSAGVTNAYVENAVSGGKTTYRLRVGPFPSREAAQAAQARLRALGYDNGFISTK